MSINYGYQPIVTNGLVLHLDAANPNSYISGSTAWNDLSGNRNNGTLINGPGYSSANFGSITFDGVNDYISVGNFPNSSLPSGSIVAWIKPSSGGLTFQQIAGKRTVGSAGGFDYMLDLSTTGRNLRGLISNATTFNMITGNTTLSYEVWYNAAFTWGGAFINIYLNGVLDATPVSQTITVSSSSTNPFDIGIARDTPSRYFVGSISNTLLYNRALSASEVQQNFNALKSRYGL